MDEDYALQVKKAVEMFERAARLADAATASLYQSPELAALYDKWFTQPIPPTRM
jgi:glutamate/aspartate transport system substrate-binding protein